MLIRGIWKQCDDDIVRPVIESEVLAADGSWLPVELLVDSGADRTVFSEAMLASLGLPHLPAEQQLGGVGGAAATIMVGTHMRLPLGPKATVTFQGTFAGLTDPDALDMSVLGRDIMRLFAAIVDQPGGVVCLIGKGHAYSIALAP